MSMFAQMLATASAPKSDVENPDVAVVPVVDDQPGTVTDPLDGVDQFAEQRARLNSGLALENFGVDISQENPVDDADTGMPVVAPETDVEVPTGDFGEEPDVSGPADDVTHDHDDAEVEFDNEMDQLEQDADSIFALNNELSQLMDAGLAIERFGFNPTAAALMQSQGLLNGTALESLALESINFTSGDHAESQLALETLGEKIKEKAAAMSAKVLHVIKSSGEKVLSVVEPLFTKINGMVSKMASASWDATKAAGRTVKAHPVKTVLAVIAAIAAVAGVVVFCSTGIPAPGAKVDAMRSFLKEVTGRINKIKWPFGKVGAKVSENGLKLLTEVDGPKGVFNVADTKTISELGWTQAAVKAMSGQLNRAWDAVKHGSSALGTRALKLAGTVGGHAMDTMLDAASVGSAAGGHAARKAGKVFGNSFAGKVGAFVVGNQVQTYVTGAYIMAIISVIMAVFNVIRAIVVGGMRLIAGTLRAVMGSSNAEPAAA